MKDKSNKISRKYSESRVNIKNTEIRMQKSQYSKKFTKIGATNVEQNMNHYSVVYTHGIN